MSGRSVRERERERRSRVFRQGNNDESMARSSSAIIIARLARCSFLLFTSFPSQDQKTRPLHILVEQQYRKQSKPIQKSTFLLLCEPLDRPPAAAKLSRDLLQRHRALGQVPRLLLELVAEGDELARGEGADVEPALVEGRRGRFLLLLRGHGFFFRERGREEAKRPRRRIEKTKGEERKTLF